LAYYTSVIKITINSDFFGSDFKNVELIFKRSILFIYFPKNLLVMSTKTKASSKNKKATAKKAVKKPSPVVAKKAVAKKKIVKASKPAAAKKTTKPVVAKKVVKKATVKKAVAKKPAAKSIKKPVAKAVTKKAAKPAAKKVVKKAAVKKVVKAVKKAAPKKAVKKIVAKAPAKKAVVKKISKPAKPVKSVKPVAVKKTVVKTPAVKPAKVEKLVAVKAVKPEKPPVVKPDKPAKEKVVIKKSIVAPITFRQEETGPVKFIKEPSGKFEMEFVIRASEDMVFEFVSTESGLSEWFCDDVTIRNGVFTFTWDGQQQQAKLVKEIPPMFIRYQWMDKNDGSYFEFKTQKDELTNDISLIITDFASDKSDEESARLLWHSQVDKLLHVLGSFF
jgi:uncharacterized protein YndB with AHSA1/START domain